jgi:hypothetical protein
MRAGGESRSDTPIWLWLALGVVALAAHGLWWWGLPIDWPAAAVAHAPAPRLQIVALDRAAAEDPGSVWSVWSPARGIAPSDANFSRAWLTESIPLRPPVRQPLDIALPLSAERAEQVRLMHRAPVMSPAADGAMIGRDTLLPPPGGGAAEPASADRSRERGRAGAREAERAGMLEWQLAPELAGQVAVEEMVWAAPDGGWSDQAWATEAELTLDARGGVRHVVLDPPLPDAAQMRALLQSLYVSRWQAAAEVPMVRLRIDWRGVPEGPP